MLDTKAFYQIAQSVASTMAKATHKPTIKNKASMEAYAKAMGTTGKKACFTLEQQAEGFDYVV